MLSATPDQAGPSGSAPGPSSDRMPTAWLSKLSIVRQLQREESARELEERGAAPEKGAQLTGVSQKGKEATGARRETSTEMGQRGSEASGATARSDMQVGGADRSAAQGVDEGRLTSRGVDLERGGEKGGLPNGAKRIRKQAKGAETRAQSEVQRLKAEERELIGRRGRSAKGVKKPEGASRKEKPDGGGARQAGSPGEPVDGGPNSNRRVSTNFPVSDSEDEAGARLPERPPAVRVETALEEAGGPQAPGSSSGGSLEGASGSSDGRAAVEKPLEGKRSLKKAPHGTGGKGVGGAAGGRSKQSAGQGSKKPAQTSEAVCCDVCDESDNPELVVVCAGDCCQKVRHIYCHSEDLEEVPEGNWFCSVGCETREGEKTGGPWELVGQPICSEPGCSKKAYWGYKGAGSLEKERCRKHKESDMVSNRVRTCEVLGCDTRPSYMPPGSKRRERCAKHKEQGMRHEHACSEPGCDIVAGWRCTITKTRRCSSHKLSGMRPRKRGKKDGPVQRIPS